MNDINATPGTWSLVRDESARAWFITDFNNIPLAEIRERVPGNPAVNAALMTESRLMHALLEDLVAAVGRGRSEVPGALYALITDLLARVRAVSDGKVTP